ncbi:MAG: hypothetical protein ABIJ47_07310 [Candidatus Bathyarchaeota archaeon]
MAKRFDERLETIRLILVELEHSPIRWTLLAKKVTGSSTPWLIQSVLNWLLSNGYVERPSRGLYRLTDRGQQLLKVLKQS